GFAASLSRRLLEQGVSLIGHLAEEPSGENLELLKNTLRLLFEGAVRGVWGLEYYAKAFRTLCRGVNSSATQVMREERQRAKDRDNRELPPDGRGPGVLYPVLLGQLKLSVPDLIGVGPVGSPDPPLPALMDMEGDVSASLRPLQSKDEPCSKVDPVSQSLGDVYCAVLTNVLQCMLNMLYALLDTTKRVIERNRRAVQRTGVVTEVNGELEEAWTRVVTQEHERIYTLLGYVSVYGNFRKNVLKPTPDLEVNLTEEDDMFIDWANARGGGVDLPHFNEAESMFDDQMTANFYNELYPLRKSLPAAMFPEVVETDVPVERHDPKEDEDIVLDPATDMSPITEDYTPSEGESGQSPATTDIDQEREVRPQIMDALHLGEGEGEGESVAPEARGSRMKELLRQLPHLLSRDEADTWCYQYVLTNSNTTRRTLVAFLSSFSSASTASLPFVCRVIATLYECGIFTHGDDDLVTAVHKRWFSLMLKAGGDTRQRVFNARYVCELVKFRLLKPIDVLRCLHKTANRIVYAPSVNSCDIEVVCTTLESLGRYLTKLPKSAQALDTIIQRIEEAVAEKKTIKPHLVLLLEQSINLVHPPAPKGLDVRQPPKILQYTQYIMDCLMSNVTPEAKEGDQLRVAQIDIAFAARELASMSWTHPLKESAYIPLTPEEEAARKAKGRRGRRGGKGQGPKAEAPPVTTTSDAAERLKEWDKEDTPQQGEDRLITSDLLVASVIQPILVNHSSIERIAQLVGLMLVPMKEREREKKREKERQARQTKSQPDTPAKDTQPEYPMNPQRFRMTTYQEGQATYAASLIVDTLVHMHLSGLKSDLSARYLGPRARMGIARFIGLLHKREVFSNAEFVYICHKSVTCKIRLVPVGTETPSPAKEKSRERERERERPKGEEEEEEEDDTPPPIESILENVTGMAVLDPDAPDDWFRVLVLAELMKGFSHMTGKQPLKRYRQSVRLLVDWVLALYYTKRTVKLQQEREADIQSRERERERQREERESGHASWKDRDRETQRLRGRSRALDGVPLHVGPALSVMSQSIALILDKGGSRGKCADLSAIRSERQVSLALKRVLVAEKTQAKGPSDSLHGKEAQLSMDMAEADESQDEADEDDDEGEEEEESEEESDGEEERARLEEEREREIARELDDRDFDRLLTGVLQSASRPAARQLHELPTKYIEPTIIHVKTSQDVVQVGQRGVSVGQRQGMAALPATGAGPFAGGSGADLDVSAVSFISRNKHNKVVATEVLLGSAVSDFALDRQRLQEREAERARVNRYILRTVEETEAEAEAEAQRDAWRHSRGRGTRGHSQGQRGRADITRDLFETYE
ncbi:hypothetical protein KIPB_000676, partial [Kipferlia bialata]